MARKIELIIGGQYDKNNTTCHNCLIKNTNTAQTIYLMVTDFEHEEPRTRPYCSLCARYFLRGLEQYLEFDVDDYARENETPEQRWEREQAEKETKHKERN